MEIFDYYRLFFIHLSKKAPAVEGFKPRVSLVSVQYPYPYTIKATLIQELKNQWSSCRQPYAEQLNFHNDKLFSDSTKIEIKNSQKKLLDFCSNRNSMLKMLA